MNNTIYLMTLRAPFGECSTVTDFHGCHAALFSRFILLDCGTAVFS